MISGALQIIKTTGNVQNVELIIITIIVMMSTKKLSRMMTMMKKLTAIAPNIVIRHTLHRVHQVLGFTAAIQLNIADHHNHRILAFTLQ